MAFHLTKGGRRTAAFAQGEGQEGVMPRPVSQPAVPGLTPEQSSQLIALLQNVQVSKVGYNSNTGARESECNTGATAFTSFTGTSKSHFKRNLCLLSILSD